MAVVVSAELVRDYFQACLARDPERLARFIDDDVTWAMTGPIDLLPFCGQWRGQTAVLNAIVRLAPKVIRLCDLEFEEILVDGDRAATFTRLSAIHAASGR